MKLKDLLNIVIVEFVKGKIVITEDSEEVLFENNTNPLVQLDENILNKKVVGIYTGDSGGLFINIK